MPMLGINYNGQVVGFAEIGFSDPVCSPGTPFLLKP
jgi:hypothetical protein